MASSEDFKKLYELYQTEGVLNGVSIVDFCQRILRLLASIVKTTKQKIENAKSK